MLLRLLFVPAAGLSLFAATIAPANGQGQRADAHAKAVGSVVVQIPESVQAEHKHIHEALVHAMRAAGEVGSAAKALAEVLDPHFKREEEIALPPLGLLAPLAHGERPSGVEEALVMSDTLRNELPRMLEEHKQIRAAVENLLSAARATKDVKVTQLAEQLSLHAQNEEEVMYPAAILVGDIIRGRQRK